MTRSSYIKNIKKLFVLLGFYGLSSPRVIGRYIKFAWLNKSSKNDLVKARVFDFDILVPTKSNGIGRALFVHQGRELDHKWMLERVLNSGDYILDLGSNIGYYVLLEAEILHSNCNILAIEPDPRNVGVLNANIALHGLDDLVDFEHCAISNFTGSTSFELAERTNLSKISEPGADHSSALSTTVQVYDFAEYSAAKQRISLLRMDVEGAEVNIFASLVKAIEDRKPFVRPQRIIFETHNYGAQAQLMHSLMDKLFLYGYTVEYMSSDDERHKNPVFHSYGYKPHIVIKEMGVSRGIYKAIRSDHAAQLISEKRGTRTVCLRFSVAGQAIHIRTESEGLVSNCYITG